MSQEPVPVPADTHKSWIERIETARDNVVEILKGKGGDPALPELLKERLSGAADQMRDIAAVDHTYHVPQSTFRDCHNRCRTAELPMNLVPGLTQEQKEIGVGLRNVANEMREIGNLHGMGLT
jgi:hypothetical protein